MMATEESDQKVKAAEAALKESEAIDRRGTQADRKCRARSEPQNAGGIAAREKDCRANSGRSLSVYTRAGNAITVWLWPRP